MIMTNNTFEMPKAPEVKFNKNGYEIRADILKMTGQVISKIDMPEFPGLDKVLETAEKMYGFVNASTKK
jgi:hypothetical protein